VQVGREREKARARARANERERVRQNERKRERERAKMRETVFIVCSHTRMHTHRHKYANIPFDKQQLYTCMYLKISSTYANLPFDNPQHVRNVKPILCLSFHVPAKNSHDEGHKRACMTAFALCSQDSL